VQPARGSLLNLPLPDRCADLVYSIEALEHAVNVPAAIRELCRLVDDGGTLVLIDKNREVLGSHPLQPAEWETWFAEAEVYDLLESHGLAVEVHRDLPYDGRDGSDHLFLGWVARRPEKEDA
jgi:ubiquinone/menaquinone biosynthesis C-methylase UbiE